MARARSFVKGKQKTGGRRKGTPNKVPGSFKASVREVFNELNGTERDQFRASLLRGLRAKPPFSAPYFRLAAEYVDGKPKAEGDGPPPGSFFQIILSKPITEDPLAHRYEPQKALRVPEEAEMAAAERCWTTGRRGPPRRSWGLWDLFVPLSPAEVSAGLAKGSIALLLM